MNVACHKLSFANLAAFSFGESAFALSKAFGSEFFSILEKKLLLPNGNFSEQLPCFNYSANVCGSYCRRKTMFCGTKNAHIAYCPKRVAPDYLVTEEMLQQFKPNIPRLMSNFAEALGIRSSIEQISYFNIWRLGDVSESAAKKHPVYFVLDTVTTTIAESLKTLLLTEITKPSVIFLATSYVPDSGLERIAQEKKCFLLHADDCVLIQTNGVVTPKDRPGRLFAPFMDHIQQTIVREFRFDFPDKTSWRDLYVHFKNNDELTFDINGSISSHTKYTMALGQAQWDLLRSFADGYGRHNSYSILSSDKEKKRLQRLNEALMKYCGTDVKPIQLSDDRKEYFCLFHLKPDWHSTNFHEAKRTNKSFSFSQ